MNDPASEKAGEDREADAELLKAIAHAARLQILTALVQGERAVGEIETLTGIAQPGLSQQLGVLRKAELVATRREGKQVFYSIAQARLAAARAMIEALLPEVSTPGRRDDEGRGDARLHEAGSPDAAPRTAGRGDPVKRRGGAAVFARITG